MKTLVITLACAFAAFAQPPVNQTAGPPPSAFTTLVDCDGAASSPCYYGVATQFLQQSNSWLKRADSTLTSIADSSNTSTVTCASACGVWIGQRVTVSGATVDTDLNGTYTVLTTPSSTTFTFTTASVADATYTESTLVISTNNPLTTQSYWTVTVNRFSSSLLVSSYFANSCSNNGGCIAWSNRTSY